MIKLHLHHRLHWPLCLTLAALLGLAAYALVAQPKLQREQARLDQLRHQVYMRQQSQALLSVQPLIDQLGQPLPSSADITSMLVKATARRHWQEPHYALTSTRQVALGSMTVTTRTLTVSFESPAPLADVAAIPALLPCHAQLTGLSVDGTSARADLVLLGQ